VTTVNGTRRDAAQVANRASTACAAKCAYFRHDDTSSPIGYDRELNKSFSRIERSLLRVTPYRNSHMAPTVCIVNWTFLAIHLGIPENHSIRGLVKYNDNIIDRKY